MSAMVEMSRAIRLTIAKHAPTERISSLPLDTLRDFTQIVGAFYLDLKEELERREKDRKQ